MGEIADMMLDGTLCAGCGDYIGDGGSFAIYCPGCEPGGASSRPAAKQPMTPAAQRNAKHNRERKARSRAADKPFKCSCGKLCRTADGLKSHQHAKHGSGGG